MADDTALFGIPLDTSVAFAEPKNGRIVQGRDISKATARAATEAERWRYGVEMRRIGSRWCPQQRAPHYPVPEPYVYRKQPQSLAWSSSDHNRDIDDDYRAWLAERDAPKPEPKAEPMTTDNVTPFPPVREPAPVHASEADRRQAAAELLREIAGQYGPRRAHKLQAMADWLVAEPAVRIARQA